jgi:hypothetical protein
MAEAPNNVALASGFTPVPAIEAFATFADLGRWADHFPGWIATIEFLPDDERYTATGPQRERFDLYPQIDEDARTIDVETVDELGSADTLRLRVLDVNGGSFVIIAHGRLKGTPDPQWDAKRAAVADGLAALSVS